MLFANNLVIISALECLGPILVKVKTWKSVCTRLEKSKKDLAPS